ncbi:MAG: hypothetical protein CMJ49_03530 [Planctomycetaceae bacterium]|nr:hypothetical protein [Planctomycetaceae bacterium]
MGLTWEELAEVKFIEHAGTKQLSLAKFSGDVHADDPKYQMTGSQLDIHWEAVAGDDQLRASRIDARDAEVITDNQGTMSGATLEVDLAEDAEGRVVPTRIVGHDGVKVEDIEQALSARELDVSVVPKVDDEATVSDIGGRLRITSLTAEGEVKVHLKKQGMHIQGDRVVSADDMAWLNLFGVPVRIFDGGMALTVPELKLSALDGPRDQVRATSDGAGRFSYIQVPTLEEAGRQVDVVWKKSMVMSPARPLVARDAAGKVKRSLRTQVEVRGKAVAKVSDLKLEENTLRSETMSIWIAGMDPVAGAAGGTKDPALAAMGLGKHRTIDQLEARGDVSLISARWTDALHTELETRMQLTEAEYLDYDRVIERVLVEGASTLVIEDYRPEPDDQATKATPITGRGMTMLTSSDQLVIDGQKTQVTVKGSAHLSHWPADNKNRRLDLRADTLVADMKGIGGLEVMRGSEVESLRMDRVHASGNVVLKDFATGMTAYADQMVYDAKQKLVELMPLPNRRVMIEIEGQLMPTGNTHIIWDLKTNTFRGKGASGGL